MGVLGFRGRHRARFDGDELATYECGPDGECTYASAALVELFGLSAADLHGNGWLRAIVGADERARVWSSWMRAVKDGIPYEDEYVISAGGKLKRVRTYTRSTRGSDGKVLCYHGLAREIKLPE